MSRNSKRTILFLCTGNYYRSRFADILFNSMTAKFGMAWQSISRGLALERGINNVGPIAAEAQKLLQEMGVRSEETKRMPLAVTEDDFTAAARIIALDRTEHEPLIRERWPAWIDRVEYWAIEDVPGVLMRIEKEVMLLMGELIGGKRPVEPEEPEPAPKVASAKPGPKPTVRLGRETKGRGGKTVTTVFELPLNENEIRDLATKLKHHCGTGGTVKDGRIEIQGDHRDRISAELQKLGYQVKRTGG